MKLLCHGKIRDAAGCPYLGGMERILTVLALLTLSGTQPCLAQIEEWTTPFERDANYSASYREAHDYFLRLAKAFPEVQVDTFGWSDGGHPLLEVVLGESGESDPHTARAKGKLVLLVNNAIHPGEPCGVDASMLFARRLLTDRRFGRLLRKVVVVIIPYYNADGGQERSPHFRANQVGPALQGFRGNARNLDLNRDFLKLDSENARSFVRLFQKWKPDLFVDTHTSNGADYAHAMTLIPTLPDKLSPALATLQQDLMLPFLYKRMADAGWPMCPYVHGDNPPEQGVRGFIDLPRYSTGYAALHGTLGFMTEAHMLKPFTDRVKATEAFLESLMVFAGERAREIVAARTQGMIQDSTATMVDIQWTIDSTRTRTIPFRGYRATTTRISEVSGLARLYYDRDQPFLAEIPYYPFARPVASVRRPAAYIIPRAWSDIGDLLVQHGITIRPIERDTTVTVTAFRIRELQTGNRPYEGHYVHSRVQVDSLTRTVTLREGDLWVEVNGAHARILIHALDPRAPDSWFAWNRFDAILDQKEYFSDYLFEETAARLLSEDASLRSGLAEAIRQNPALAKDAHGQLDWIYRRSPWLEPSYRIYPIWRVE